MEVLSLQSLCPMSGLLESLLICQIWKQMDHLENQSMDWMFGLKCVWSMVIIIKITLNKHEHLRRGRKKNISRMQILEWFALPKSSNNKKNTSDYEIYILKKKKKLKFRYPLHKEQKNLFFLPAILHLRLLDSKL